MHIHSQDHISSEYEGVRVIGEDSIHTDGDTSRRHRRKGRLSFSWSLNLPLAKKNTSKNCVQTHRDPLETEAIQHLLERGSQRVIITTNELSALDFRTFGPIKHKEGYEWEPEKTTAAGEESHKIGILRGTMQAAGAIQPPAKSL